MPPQPKFVRIRLSIIGYYYFWSYHFIWFGAISQHKCTLPTKAIYACSVAHKNEYWKTHKVQKVVNDKYVQSQVYMKRNMWSGDLLHHNICTFFLFLIEYLGI